MLTLGLYRRLTTKLPLTSWRKRYLDVVCYLINFNVVYGDGNEITKVFEGDTVSFESLVMVSDDDFLSFKEINGINL